MRHIIRIGPDWLRRLLLAVALPFMLADYAIHLLANEPRRLLQVGAFDMVGTMFWLAWDGTFV